MTFLSIVIIIIKIAKTITSFWFFIKIFVYIIAIYSYKNYNGFYSSLNFLC